MLNKFIHNDNCIICSSKVAYKITDKSRFPGNIFYTVCEGCGLVRRSPTLTWNQAYKIYNSGFYYDQNSNSSSNIRNYSKIEKDRFYSDISRLNFLKKTISLNKIKTSLEIGCGVGSFVEILKKNGIDAIGIEPDKDTAKYAKEKKLNIICNFFENIKFNRKFDLIVLLHVFEHFVSPLDSLRNISMKLSHNGFIFIEVPNIHNMWTSFDFWFQGFDSTHSYNYTKTSLINSLKIGGFKVLNIESSHVLRVIAFKKNNCIESDPLEFRKEHYLCILFSIYLFRIKHFLRKIMRNFLFILFPFPKLIKIIMHCLKHIYFINLKR